MKAFGKKEIIWETHDQNIDAPWQEIWKKRLESAIVHAPTSWIPATKRLS